MAEKSRIEQSIDYLISVQEALELSLISLPYFKLAKADRSLKGGNTIEALEHIENMYNRTKDVINNMSLTMQKLSDLERERQLLNGEALSPSGERISYINKAMDILERATPQNSSQGELVDNKS